MTKILYRRSVPEKYRGFDFNGFPLDPKHPWNTALPPDERARRLIEIEEYIAAREAAEANKKEGS